MVSGLVHLGYFGHRTGLERAGIGDLTHVMSAEIPSLQLRITLVELRIFSSLPAPFVSHCLLLGFFPSDVSLVQ